MRRRNNGDAVNESISLAELPVFIAKGKKKRCFTAPCSLRRFKGGCYFRQAASLTCLLVTSAFLAGGRWWLRTNHGRNSGSLNAEQPIHDQVIHFEMHRPNPRNLHEVNHTKLSFPELVQFVEKKVRKEKTFLPITTKAGTAMDYDVFNCPPTPPLGYPRDYPVMDVLRNWPLDDTTYSLDRSIYQGICIFDFATTFLIDEKVLDLQSQIAAYRQKEVPFVIRNDPAVLDTVERWNTNNYMFELLKGRIYRSEISTSNHMMYWNIVGGYTEVPNDWKPPTWMRPMSFADWYDIANSTNTKPTDEHVYIRMDGCHSSSSLCDSSYRRTGLIGSYRGATISDADFWFGEMTFFNPDFEDSLLYIVNAQKQRGIQCRFGMEGILAENHFDNDRNFVAVLGGERRYLLGHPKNCKGMALYKHRHPMERHSMVDWSRPNLTEHPDFETVRVNEAVLQAGDVLYLPTYWFHTIVSLSLNYQCNTRSGYTSHYEQLIQDCGFHYTPP